MDRIMDRPVHWFACPTLERVFDFHAPGRADVWYFELNRTAVFRKGRPFHFQPVFVVVIGAVFLGPLEGPDFDGVMLLVGSRVAIERSRERDVEPLLAR